MKIVLNPLLVVFYILVLNGCGGGKSLPHDDDNISVVKLTDLRLGYLVKGILYGPDESIYHDIKFCNFDAVTDVYFDEDTHTYFINQYEIADDTLLVFDDGAIFDTNDTGTFEEKETYSVTGVQGIIFTWYIGSISLINCEVEPI